MGSEGSGSGGPGSSGAYRGLLVDYGGVLTTDLFDSFRAFCELEGLAPDADWGLTSPAWALVYWDDFALVYLKRSTAWADVIERVSWTNPGPDAVGELVFTAHAHALALLSWAGSEGHARPAS